MPYAMTHALRKEREMGDKKDDPIEYLKSANLSRHDLFWVFGSRARISEVFGKKRALSIHHIRRLHFSFGLDASKLIAPYEAGNSTPHNQEPKADD